MTAAVDGGSIPPISTHGRCHTLLNYPSWPGDARGANPCVRPGQSGRCFRRSAKVLRIRIRIRIRIRLVHVPETVIALTPSA
ncbi:MAG: hypothetical protein JWQ68_2016 [Cryobacterium sp.]|nr:hypothetical protein [Cryobacterium sp.]